MSEISGKFTLDGVICANDDGPGMCTPVFRRDDIESLFIQEFDDMTRNVVTGFYRIAHPPFGSIKRVSSNQVFEVGCKLNFGLCLKFNNIFVGSYDRLIAFIEANMSEIGSHPFLLYQAGIICKRHGWILEALLNDEVLEAARSGVISLPKKTIKSDDKGWSDTRIEILILMWNAGFSGSQIAKLVGTTRNAVIGKVHRLGLSSRSSESFDRVESSEPADETKPKRRGWWSLGR